MTLYRHTILLFFAAVALSPASAEPNADPPRGPPPELVEACKGKKVGDSCSLIFGGRSVTGVCLRGRNDVVMCGPSDKPSEPPAEMFDACKGKKERDACTSPIEGQAVPGHCTSWKGKRLLCRPGPWRQGE